MAFRASITLLYSPTSDHCRAKTALFSLSAPLARESPFPEMGHLPRRTSLPSPATLPLSGVRHPAAPMPRATSAKSASFSLPPLRPSRTSRDFFQTLEPGFACFPSIGSHLRGLFQTLESGLPPASHPHPFRDSSVSPRLRVSFPSRSPSAFLPPCAALIPHPPREAPHQALRGIVAQNREGRRPSDRRGGNSAPRNGWQGGVSCSSRSRAGWATAPPRLP